MSKRFFPRFAAIGMVTAVVLMAPAISWGQENGAPPTPPSGPLLRPAPDFSQWITTFSYPQDATKKIDALNPDPRGDVNGAPRIVNTTRTGDLTRESTIDLLGRTTERWYVGSTEYRKMPNDPTWYEDNLATGSGLPFVPPPPGGFRGFDAVSAQAYAGTIKYQGHDCFVFIPGGAKAAITNEEELQNVADVLIIDAGTRFPVEARAAGVVRVFQFTSPPTTKLVFPSDLVAEIKKGQQGRVLEQARPGRPY